MKTRLVAIIFVLTAMLMDTVKSTAAPTDLPFPEGTFSMTDSVSIVVSTGNGGYYESYTTYSNLIRMPRWNPDKTEPPLLPAAAARIAEKYARDQFSGEGKVDIFLEQVALRSWRGTSIWYYDVELLAGIEPYNGTIYYNGIAHPGSQRNLEIAVLMGGTVADQARLKIDPMTFHPIHIGK